MRADGCELKPHLSWYAVWWVLECGPLMILVLVTVGAGRWWNVPLSIWPSGRDVLSKERWVAWLGGGVAIAMILMASRLRVGSCTLSSGLHSSGLVGLGPKRGWLGWSVLLAVCLILITVLQLASWYRDRWVPTLNPRVHGALDYRYFQVLDLRLQQVANEIRDGTLVFQGDVVSLRRPADGSESLAGTISAKQLILELREYVIDWSETAFANAQDEVERKASLEMLAMIVDPDPKMYQRYRQWKAEEESRLAAAIRDAAVRAEGAKAEHESIAVQWREEKVAEKKSILANRLVAAEDRLNEVIREGLRLQGRLEVLANENLYQQGLNREYPWLHLPTVSRGGWLRVASSWLVALYLVLRLLIAVILATRVYLDLRRTSRNEQSGLVDSCNGTGWLLCTAGLWWLGLGW